MEQKICRCCMAESGLDSLDMKSAKFTHNNQRITFIAGYSSITGCSTADLTKIPVAGLKICQLCVVHLESAYIFREMCKATNKMLEEKFLNQPLPLAGSIKQEKFTNVPKISAPRTLLQNKKNQMPPMVALPRPDVVDWEKQIVVTPVTPENVVRVKPDIKATSDFHKAKVKVEEPESDPEPEVEEKLYGNDVKITSFNSDQSIERTEKRIKHCRKEGLYKCMVCKKGYKHKQTALTHLEHAHLDSSNDEDDDATWAKRHLTTVSSTDKSPSLTFKCQDCSMSFNSFGLFYKHNKKEHDFGQEPTFDTSQNRITASPETIFPESAHGDNSNNPSMCSTSSSMPYVVPNQMEHIDFGLLEPSTSMHFMDDTSSPMDVECSVGATNQPAIKRLRCTDCPRSFKTPAGLRCHMTAEHQQIKYNCDLCPEQFNSFSYLQYHNKVDHLKIRHTCKVCNEQMRSLQLLWSHSFIHRGFVPFNCMYCQYKTANKGHFNTHLAKIHKIKFMEDIHGYKAETRDEVLSFVR